MDDFGVQDLPLESTPVSPGGNSSPTTHPKIPMFLDNFKMFKCFLNFSKCFKMIASIREEKAHQDNDL